MADQRADSHADDLACIQAVELVTEYIEGALPEEDARRLERHLGTCPGCTDYVKQMRTLAGGLARLSEGSIPAGMRDGLVAAFRDFHKR